MDIKALYQKISEQNFRLRRVLGNTNAPGAAIEQTKNVLYNNAAAIEEALAYAADAEKKIQILEVELDDAERELDEKDKLIKELSEKKTTKSKKTAEPVNG